MIFNFELGGKEYSMDLPAIVRVAITRHLLKLYQEYRAANPNENIDFDAYLTLVEASPHPENVPVTPPESEDDDYIEDSELMALAESLKRKDKVIDGLLKLIGDTK